MYLLTPLKATMKFFARARDIKFKEGVPNQCIQEAVICLVNPEVNVAINACLASIMCSQLFDLIKIRLKLIKRSGQLH